MLGSSMMCDSCGTKINLISRKFCVDCSQYFCAHCVTSSRSPYQCRRCEVFKSNVIRRQQLERLSLNDLKYYLRTRNIDAPLSAAKSQLLDWVLSDQAKRLSERARCALEELTGTPGLNHQEVDISLLEPHSSRYSHSAQTPQSSLSRGSTAEIRSEIQRHVHLEKNLSQVMALSDIHIESQIHELSVRQLKTILQANCVNYKGCVEKHELLERVVRLWQSRQDERIREAEIEATGDHAAETEYLCKVCMDAPVDCVLLECGHMISCVKCGRQLAECPICRHYVSRVVHAFKV